MTLYLLVMYLNENQVVVVLQQSFPFPFPFPARISSKGELGGGRAETFITLLNCSGARHTHQTGGRRRPLAESCWTSGAVLDPGPHAPCKHGVWGLTRVFSVQRRLPSLLGTANTLDKTVDYSGTGAKVFLKYYFWFPWLHFIVNTHWP